MYYYHVLYLVSNVLQSTQKISCCCVKLNPPVLLILQLRGGGGGPVHHLADLVGGQPVHQAAVSDIALPYYEVGHPVCYVSTNQSFCPPPHNCSQAVRGYSAMSHTPWGTGDTQEQAQISTNTF